MTNHSNTDSVDSLRIDIDLPDAGESVGLATRARAGDQKALSELLSRHESWLRRRARVELSAKLRRHVDSMDVVQEVGLIATRRIVELRSTHEASLRAWLRAILHNFVMDQVTRFNADKRNRPEVALDAPLASGAGSAAGLQISAGETRVDERAAKTEMRELLDEIVGELPDDERAVVLLRDYDHTPWDEIREELSKSTVNAAQVLHNRAWKRIVGEASKRLARRRE